MRISPKVGRRRCSCPSQIRRNGTASMIGISIRPILGSESTLAAGRLRRSDMPRQLGAVLSLGHGSWRQARRCAGINQGPGRVPHRDRSPGLTMRGVGYRLWVIELGGLDPDGIVEEGVRSQSREHGVIVEDLGAQRRSQGRLSFCQRSRLEANGRGQQCHCRDSYQHGQLVTGGGRTWQQGLAFHQSRAAITPFAWSLGII